jgi:hypothetical protein
MAGFDHLAHLEHLARFFDAGLGHEGAPRRFQRDQVVAAELVQRLAHQRAADLEDVGDLLLGELGAGHQAALDDGGGDGLDDALRGARSRTFGVLRGRPRANDLQVRAAARGGGAAGAGRKWRPTCSTGSTCCCAGRT